MFFSNRFRAQSAAIVLLCLLAVLFMGCQPDPDPEVENIGFIPLGEWTDDWGSGYNITNSSFEYYTADSEWEGTIYPGKNHKGSIVEAVDFSEDAGVLLIQITTSTINSIEDKFIGVYYKDYTASHVFLANAIDESFDLIVRNTLTEAKNTFTVDKVGDHVAYWGTGYTK